MSNIKRFVAGCEKCQATKPNHQQKQVQHHPNTGKEVERLEGNTPSVDTFLEVMERTKREVKMALEKTNEVMEWKFNVGKKTEIDFQKGDLV